MKTIKLTNRNGAKILVNVEKIISVEDYQQVGVDVPYRSYITFDVTYGKRKSVSEFSGVAVKESLTEIERLIKEVNNADKVTA